MLRTSDAYHLACVEESRSLPYPLFTSWPAITEAAWLLRAVPNGVDKLLEGIEQGLVTPLDLDPASVPWMRAFLDKYHDLGAQLADASLCYLSEREEIGSIFTLDRRDFATYRTPQNQPFHLLPESLQV